MRSSLRSLVAVGSAALVAATLAPVGPATAHPGQDQTVLLTVNNSSRFEYQKTCRTQPPSDCQTEDTRLAFIVGVAVFPEPSPVVPTDPFTVDFLLEDITAVHGVNYAGPISGTLLIEPRNGEARTNLLVPVLDTGGTGEPDKTLRVRLTGTSLPDADLSDTGIGTIRSGGLVPRDCDPSRPDGLSISMTCTDRPAGDEWTVRASCQFEGGGFPFWKDVFGPVVTGNGSTSASCTEPNFMRFSGWSFVSLD